MKKHILHYAKLSGQLLFTTTHPKLSNIQEAIIVNPRHQTPQGQGQLQSLERPI